MDENKERIEEELAEETPEEEQANEAPEPTETDEDIERLRSTIARLQADFANFKNRTERERSDSKRYANESLVLKILPVVDNFERALENADPEDPCVAGFRMIYEELTGIFAKEGIEPVESTGEPFDPNLHHALFLEETDEHEPDTITETFQKGYKYGEKLIRPAMVKVSKPKQEDK